MIETVPTQAGPASFLEMRSRMVARYPELSPQLQSIAQFALSHPDAMALETVAELARRVGAPPSSIVRFAQAMGYSGFAEMKRHFSAHLMFRAKATEEPEQGPGGQEPDHPVRLFLANGRRDLDGLERDFDLAAFDRAVASLVEAKQIYVTAQHLAYGIASLLAWSLIEAGHQCQLLDNVGGYALRQSQLAGPNEATVCISFSPYQPSVVQEAQAHRERGGTVVAITDTPFSPLAPHASELLVVPGLKGAADVSLAGAICVVRALAAAVIERSREKTVKRPPAGRRQGKRQEGEGRA